MENIGIAIDRIPILSSTNSHGYLVDPSPSPFRSDRHTIFGPASRLELVT